MSDLRIRLASAMKSRGASITSMATAAGLARPVLSRILGGHREPTLDHLVALADALGCRPGELLDGPDPRIAELERQLHVTDQLLALALAKKK